MPSNDADVVTWHIVLILPPFINEKNDTKHEKYGI